MNEVDKRVVEFDFDNRNFEKNVNESITTVDRLKDSLNFEDVSKSLDVVVTKFASFQMIAINVLSNISSQIVNMGIQMTKSLTIDNVGAGWQNYSNKTISVATMAAQQIKIAGKTIEDQSDKIDAIDQQLTKLNWFTDQTSYSFVNMVDNIGKFTAAGQDLDASVEAMMGIANWAALSGQNAQTASRAMYQLSQALSKGYVQLIDWKSIQNANMDTQEFRKTVLETAVAMGQLTKEGENFITKTGAKFTQNQFTEQLNSKWFTSDVLTKSLAKYSSAVDQIYKISEETGLTAAQVIARYGDELDEFGLKAFAAAQEARTFEQAIVAIKDAVTTGWMTTAEKIFGAYTDSKELWTDLADELYEIFAEGGNFRNEILSVWNALSGRDDLFKRGGPEQGAFWNLFDALTSIINTVKSSINEIFPISQFEDFNEKADDLGNRLKSITSGIKSFTKTISEIVESSQFLHNVITGVLSVLKVGVQLVFSIRYALEPLIFVTRNVVQEILGLVSSIGLALTSTQKLGSFISNVSTRLYFALDKILNGLNLIEITEVLIDNIKVIGRGLDGIIKSFVNGFLKAFNSTDTSFIDMLSDGLTIISYILKQIALLSQKFILPLINILASKLGQISGTLVATAINLINYLSTLVTIIYQMLNGTTKLKTSLDRVGGAFDKIGKQIKKFVNDVKGYLNIESNDENGSVSLIQKIEEYFGITKRVKEGTSEFAENLTELEPVFELGVTVLKNLWKLATVFGSILVTFVKAISDVINVEQLHIWLTLIVGLTAFIGVIYIIGKKIYDLAYLFGTLVHGFEELLDEVAYLIDNKARAYIIDSVANIIKMFAVALLSMAVSFTMMSYIDSNKLKDAISAMTTFMGIVTIIVVVMMTLSKATASLEHGVSGVVENFQKMQETFIHNNFRAIRKMIMWFSVMLLAMGISFMMIAKVPWENLIIYQVAVAGFMAGMIGCMFLLNKLANIMNTSFKSNSLIMSYMMSFSAMLLVISASIAKVAKLSWESIIITVLSLSAMFYQFIMLLSILSEMQLDKGTTLANLSLMAVLSGLLLGVSASLSLLSMFDWNAILVGMISMGATLIAMTTALYAISKIKVRVGTTLSNLVLLSAMASSLVALTGSIALLKGVSVQTILVSIGAITAFLYAFTGAIALLSKIKMNPGYVLLFSVALIALAAAVQGFALAMRLIEDIDYIGAAKGLLVLSAGLTLLSVVGALVGLAVPVLMALATSIITLGVGLMLTSQAIELFAATLSPLVDNLTKNFDSIFTMIEAFIERIIGYITVVLPDVIDIILNVISGIIAGIKTIFMDIVEAFKEFLPLLFQLVQDVSLAFFDSIKNTFPEMLNTLEIMITGINTLLEKTAPSFMSVIVAIINNVLAALKSNAASWNNAIVDIINEIIESTRTKLPVIVKVLGDFIEDFTILTINDLGNRLEPIISAALIFVLKSIDALGKSFKKTTPEMVKTFEEFGKNIVDGLFLGIGEFVAQRLSSIPIIGKQIANGFRDAFGIHSPSTVFAEMGTYLMLGLEKGIKDNVSGVNNVANDAMTEIVSNVANVLDNELDEDALTIRPVLDLTNIEDGTSDIASLMSSISGQSVSLSGRMANMVANGFARENGTYENQNGNVVNNNSNDSYNVVFNVTTNDPEEFARQTDAILQRMRVQGNLAKGGNF